MNSVLLLSMMAVVLIVAWRIRLVAANAEAVPAETTELGASPNGSAAIRLSRREREVLDLVAEGYSNTMIASRLRISDSTVKGYVENLLSTSTPATAWRQWRRRRGSSCSNSPSVALGERARQLES